MFVCNEIIKIMIFLIILWLWVNTMYPWCTSPPTKPLMNCRRESRAFLCAPELQDQPSRTRRMGRSILHHLQSSHHQCLGLPKDAYTWSFFRIPT